MGVIDGIIDLTTGAISYGLTMLIVATFLGAIRPALAPLLENAELFPNGVTSLAIYDLIILVFAGIGILILLISAINAGKQTREAIRERIG